jgi:hypothetical protein
MARALTLGGCDTGRNPDWPLTLDDYAAARIPIKLDVSGEVDLHLREAVFEFGEEAENFAACHQLARGREDNTDAEVFRVTLNLNAVEVRRRGG